MDLAIRKQNLDGRMAHLNDCNINNKTITDICEEYFSIRAEEKMCDDEQNKEAIMKNCNSCQKRTDCDKVECDGYIGITLHERALESAQARVEDMKYRVAHSHGNEETKSKNFRSLEVAKYIYAELDRKIPKKPYFSAETASYYCPVCRRFKLADNPRKNGYVYNFCPNCGNAIDMSEVEG